MAVASKPSMRQYTGAAVTTGKEMGVQAGKEMAASMKERTARYVDDVNAGKGNFVLALIFSLIYDALDLAATFVSAGSSEFVEFFVNIWFHKEYKKLLGEKYNGVAQILSTIEFIPGVDSLPLYTFATIWAFLIAPNISGSQSNMQRDVNINVNQQKTKVQTYIHIGIFLLVFAFIGFFFFSNESAAYLGQAPYNFIAGGGWKIAVSNLNEFFVNFGTKVGETVDERIEAAITGNVYVGEVDRYATEELGLEIEFEDQETAISKERTLQLLATVSGRALDPSICNKLSSQSELNCGNQEISVSCFSDNQILGAVTPQTFSFSTIEDTFQSVRCAMDASKLKNGANEITIEAQHGFLTSAYYTAEFTTKNKHDELLRNDNFEFYRSQTATTQGPVKIEYNEIKQQPVIVGDDGFLNLAFRIKNNADGIITKFNRITFTLPEGIELENIGACNIDVDRTFGDITVDSSVFARKQFRDLVNGEKAEINCFLRLTSGVLGVNDQTVIDSFNVITEYEYRTRDKVIVTAKAPVFIQEITARNTSCSTLLTGGNRACRCPTGKIIYNNETCVS